MKIAVYGATGMIGSAVVSEAAHRGIDVTGLSRHAGSSTDQGSIDHVRLTTGDATDLRAVHDVAATNDAVVLAAGPSREPGGDRQAFVELLRGVMGAVGDTRLVVVGGAGSLLVDATTRLVDLPDFPEAYRPEALVQSDALALLRVAPGDLNWTYLSPAPEIAPGERSGHYTVGGDYPAGGHITVADFAVALVDELEHPAHVRERFTVAN